MAVEIPNLGAASFTVKSLGKLIMSLSCGEKGECGLLGDFVH
jgi:hypothetical protein